MSISDWIEKREMRGLPTFSYKEIRDSFPSLSAQVASTELYRLEKKKRIQSVHKGFYSIVPITDRESGEVWPYHYIDQLMKHLRKPYYISLLSAAGLHGAAHQQPQKLMLTTTLPRTSSRNRWLIWCYRQSIPQNLLCQANTDTSTIQYSNPELTAIDLVRFSSMIGGLSSAATVLEELSEKVSFQNCGEELVEAATLPTLQRLGYILDVILDEHEQADAIHNLLIPHSRSIVYRPLSRDVEASSSLRDTRWKIIINKDIQPDDL